MNNFEYLRNITIGQYLPLASYLHRLDPRTRIVALGLILTAAVFTSHPYGLLLCLAVVAVGLVLGQIPIGYALRGLITPLPFLIILAMLQIFINLGHDTPPTLFQLGSIIVSPADLLAGAMLLLRFCVFILTLSLASFCISTSEFIYGLESLLHPLTRFGVPTHDIVATMQVTLRFLPLLAQSIEHIAKAQAARGQEWDTNRGGLIQRIRCILPILVPLLLTSLRRAENLALAMDARGYGTNPNRTSLAVFRFRPRDIISMLIVFIFTILAIIWPYL